MDGQMDDEWVGVYVCVYVCIDGWVFESMNRWMGGQTFGWMDE